MEKILGDVVVVAIIACATSIVMSVHISTLTELDSSTVFTLSFLVGLVMGVATTIAMEGT
jgi:hypothetical protein